MSNSDILSAQEALAQARGRVLLINPPVIDSRYEWIRWNQPLDLLKLGTKLTQERGCQVKLFDFMLPTPAGIVSRRQSHLNADLPAGEPIRWQLGQSWEVFDDYLDALTSDDWVPDSVWITTLTSFWWQTVPMVINRVKNKLKRPPVVLYGNYPALQTQHAAQFGGADIVVEKCLSDLAASQADFTLYAERLPKFCALDLRCSQAFDEIAWAVKHGISHFVFFNDNIFKAFDSRLQPLLDRVVERKAASGKAWDIRFHGICGVETHDFPLSHARLLAQAGFNELHLEPACKEGIVDEAHYRLVLEACEQAGFVERRGLGWESRRHYLSGFMWIGRPDDDVDKLVWNALKLLQLVGMVIPKPYSPTPGTSDYTLLESQVEFIEPEDISPHRLPFAGHNRLAKDDYKELYRLTALLNRKVRGHTFDFLGDTFLNKVIRESLAGRRWDVSSRRKSP
ncbi:MAG: hypothetical protein JW850_23870 [Thermoflexales bacterium]|nr:hypothetical protein [Thermoflexales bacterium]